MIIAKLIGGLGNQMFQYALGRAVSLKRGDELLLDHSFFQEKGSHTPREYELDIFNLPVRKASEEELMRFSGGRFSRYKNDLLGLIDTSKVYHRIHEAGHYYQPRVFDKKGNLHFVGYWQTEKYFAEIGDVIRKDFDFIQPATGRNAELIREISDHIGVSLHIRRGDYVSNTAANSFHGLCDLDYYASGVQYIMERAPQVRFYVFSDDIQWAKENLHIPAPTVFVDHNSGKQSWEDMRLMSLCHHHIIANSSFSWWGAWLNPRTDKIVVAPKRWFADPAVSTPDIIPSTWIKM